MCKQWPCCPEEGELCGLEQLVEDSTTCGAARLALRLLWSISLRTLHLVVSARRCNRGRVASFSSFTLSPFYMLALQAGRPPPALHKKVIAPPLHRQVAK